MKKLFLIVTIAVLAAVKTGAQTPQPGSVYYNANLFAQDLKEIEKELGVATIVVKNHQIIHKSENIPFFN